MCKRRDLLPFTATMIMNHQDLIMTSMVELSQSMLNGEPRVIFMFPEDLSNSSLILLLKKIQV